MHPVSRRQLNAMLDIFGQVPEPIRFDVACLNHQTDRLSLRRTWAAPQVRRAFGWLAARNATGSSCYIRPARAIPETRWIVIDELTDETLSRLTAVHTPSMVIRTAADVFEAWLRLDRPVDFGTRIAAVRFLKREFGGDADAVDGAQFGLLPGTTNRALSGVRAGRAPFAVLRSTSSTAVVPIPSDVAGPVGSNNAGKKAGLEVERNLETTDGPGDRDFAIACRLLEGGADDHTITAAIAAVRGFDPKCRGAYIPRTIRAARLHLQTRRQ